MSVDTLVGDGIHSVFAQIMAHIFHAGVKDLNGVGGVLTGESKRQKKQRKKQQQELDKEKGGEEEEVLGRCCCCAAAWDRYIGKKKCRMCGVPVLLWTRRWWPGERETRRMRASVISGCAVRFVYRKISPSPLLRWSLQTMVCTPNRGETTVVVVVVVAVLVQGEEQEEEGLPRQCASGAVVTPKLRSDPDRTTVPSSA